MKINLRIFILAAFAVVLLCALNSFAQVKVGGYKIVPTDDAAVIEAAEFAANAQSDRSNTTINNETIETAQKQIVAGTNYRICMQISIPVEGGEPVVEFAQTIVYQNLQQEYTLKSWLKVKSCG